MSRPIQLGVGLACAGLLAACATVAPPAEVAVPTPAQWQTPMPQSAQLAQLAVQPHQASVPELVGWWQQWPSAVLADLQAQAQAASPDVATAATRVAQARHATVVAGAQQTPAVDASAAALRGRVQPNLAPVNQASVGLNVAWELDVWGGLAAQGRAAQQRLSAAQAQWHEARVAVAAEVARQYVGWQTCQRLAAVAQDDAKAREVQAQVVNQRVKVGLEAPAQADAMAASAAQGRMQWQQAQTRCEVSLAALAALTGQTMDALKPRLLAEPVLAPLALSLPQQLPAATLAQRPDVAAAQAAVAAASADVGAADADRYPRLSLLGNIVRTDVRGALPDGTTWSLGPLQLSVPLLDGGRRTSQVKVQQAAYEEAVVRLKSVAHQAVREVEQALLSLNSATAQQADAALAAERLQQAQKAAQARYQVGMASLLELESARRDALAAQTVQVDLQRERLWAWIDLYRAYGGGWSAKADAVAVSTQP